MVRHDAPSDELVVRIVAFDECVLDDVCNFGVPEVAVAMAGVFVVGDAAGELFLGLASGFFVGRLEKFLEFFFPFLNYVEGEGIG